MNSTTRLILPILGATLVFASTGCRRHRDSKTAQAAPAAQAAPKAVKPADVDLPSLSTATFILAGFDRTPPRDPRGPKADQPLVNYVAYLLSAKPEAKGPIFASLDQNPEFHDLNGRIAPLLQANLAKEARDGQIRDLVAPVLRKLTKEQGAEIARKVVSDVLSGTPRDVWVTYPFPATCHWDSEKGLLWLGFDDSGHRWGRSAPCKANYESVERDALEHAIVNASGDFMDHVSEIFLENLWITIDPTAVDQITQVAKDKGLKVAFMNFTGFWKAQKLAILNGATREVLLEVNADTLALPPKRPGKPATVTL
jgi:hypothetical protein